MALREFVGKDPNYFGKIKLKIKDLVPLYSLFKESLKNSKLDSYFKTIHVLKTILSRKIDYRIPYFNSYNNSRIHKFKGAKNFLKNNYYKTHGKEFLRSIFEDNFFKQPSLETIPIFLKSFSKIFHLKVKFFNYDLKKLVYESNNETVINSVVFEFYKTKLYFVKKEAKLDNMVI